MIIMGIDPGIARVGWAVVNIVGSTPKAIAYGCIETSKTHTHQDRLITIYESIGKLLIRHAPECVSMEELFFSTNTKTAMSVGEARGILILAAGKKKVPVISYSPLTVKQTITGSGKADKIQIQRMITTILKLKEVPKPDDTADALAIALTHAYSYRMKGKSI